MLRGTEFRVTLFVPGRNEVWRGQGSLVPGATGMYVRTDGPKPPLWAMVRARLNFPDRELTCGCEVVRHVTAEQAVQWSMKPGFAVQFLEASAALRAALT